MATAKTTNQMNSWTGDFGREYTDRNPQSVEEMNALYEKLFGVSRVELNQEFLGDLDRDLRILEVGSNVGVQLQILQKMGFHDLYGIELQHYALELSKQKTQNINLIWGSAFDIPFRDGFFELVFTSGVLIHISPNDIAQVLSEINRCSKKYVWGFEYYADEYQSIEYRGRKDLLWKTNFRKLYQEHFPSLQLVKEKRVSHINSSNKDLMFLLEKNP
jgi:pseudaminic acid biosynthesis-associated methylase